MPKKIQVNTKNLYNMKEKRKLLFDIEADALLDNVTKIHCLAWCDTKTGLVNSTSYIDQIKDFFLQEDVIFVGHNIQLYDIPAVEKVLGIKVKADKIDTLALSWILYPNREKHSLESYEDEAGVKKVKIDDWNNLSIQDYISRCENDVKINYHVWKNQGKYLNNLYEGNHEEIYRFLDYIQFKLDCVAEHQKLGVRLDIDLCNKSLKELEEIKDSKFKKLLESMPKKANKSVKFPPKVMFKKDGSPSENRIKWLKFLEEQGLPADHNQEVEYISSYEEPNPNSNPQIKEWLFSLGWEPEHYKYIREEGKKEMRKVPQIKSKDDTDGTICPSIIKLIEKEPALEALDSLFILSHRISLFKGFLRDSKNGRIYQGISGLTNTLRLQHQGIVNLPNAKKAYAENVRKCLIADKDKIMLGSDLKSIEDSTKRHYIYPLDPEYVKEQMIEGFDAHLDIANLAGFLTKEQVEEHKLYENSEGKEGKSYKNERGKGKTVNFAAVYGVGAPTLSRNSGLSEKECKKLLDIYWKRNWAVKTVSESFKVKEIFGQKWIQNPISKFWYSLRAEKDKFSTVNQSSAVYVFDRFLWYLRNKNILVNFQVHDEWTTNIFEEHKERFKEKVNTSIKELNEELKLNVTIGCSIDFGRNYSEAH